VHRVDVAILGVPFDSGTSYRPGARFGPQAVRRASRLLRTAYHPALDVQPFSSLQVADAGDVPVTPFSIPTALASIESACTGLLDAGATVVMMGGDHTVTYAALRAAYRRYGAVAIVHFDAHLDTWDTYFEAPHTHGTFLRRAAEERLFLKGASCHVGIRGPVYARQDIADDAALGFTIVGCPDVHREGTEAAVRRIRETTSGHPLYISVDIDVLDPAHAPGTGTPEVGGLSTRELLEMLRGLAGTNIIGADVVEVAPAYDHADITALAAATLVYELVALLSVARGQR
jgi:agmatinase